MIVKSTPKKGYTETMDNIGIFETNIRKFLPTNETLWSKDVTIMVSHAGDIDRLRERCAQDARDIARSFEKFACLVREGQFFSEPSPQPHYELTRNMAMLQGHTKLFILKIQGLLSRNDEKSFWALVGEAFEEVGRK